MSSCNNQLRAGFTSLYSLLALLLPALLFPLQAGADIASATAAMENPQNPLFQLNTSRGQIFIEMLPREAPANATRIMALAQGEIEIVDADNGFSFFPRYYDGLRFHRVIPGFIIQAGSPAYHPLGPPEELLADEINADALGLGEETVLNPDTSVNARLNVVDEESFATQVLAPLYESMNITSADDLQTRQNEVYERLQNLTVKRLYEMQGYRYLNEVPTRPVSRGTMALANTGPNSNGAEFFIALADLPTLTGKYTVIGQVVEGMGIVDEIGGLAIDPERFSRLSTVIYSLQAVNPVSEADAP